MYRNKIILAVIAIAVVAAAFLFLSKQSETQVKLGGQAKSEVKTAQAVRTDQVAKPVTRQISDDTPTKPQPTSKQSLPLTTEQTDLGWLNNEVVDYYAKRAEYMLDNPVHHGRAKLQKQMRNETARETFLNLVGNDNFAMLMLSMSGYPLSPGVYESDIMIVSKMTRVRKLLADARENPHEVTRFLEQQIKTLAAEYPSQYEAYQEELKKEATQGYLVSSELPDYKKTRILCTAAVYVLSQIDAFDSLPALAWLSKQGDGGKNSLPVNPKFLFYAMHRLIQKSSGSNISAQGQEIRDKYLEKTQAMNIPNARSLEVPTWNAFYHEDDFRKKLPGSKIDLSLQPTISLERFPLLRDLSTSRVDFLLRELCKFADLS